MSELTDAVNAIETRTPQVLEVLKYPHAKLMTASVPVIPGRSSISAKGVKDFFEDMVATMQANRAIGLAAIQVGVPYRMLVIQDTSLTPLKIVNPRIVSTDGRSFDREGCLSFPGTFVRIARPETVTVEYFDENMVKQTATLQGLLARAIVHEIEHLDGKTYLDQLGNVERSEVLRKAKLRTRKLESTLRRFGQGR